MSSRVLETDDGGATWRPARWPFTTDEWSFRNTRDGWVEVRVIHHTASPGCNTFNQPYVTFNGGRSWSKRPAGPGCYTLPSFANGKDGWMLVDPDEYQLFGPPGNCYHDYGCPSALLRTVDGGRTWMTEHPVTQDEPDPASLGKSDYWPGGPVCCLEAPIFVDAWYGWMESGNSYGGAPPLPGESGGVSTTADGGRTWHLHHLGLGSFQLAVVSTKEAWVTVETWNEPNRSYVLHTTDGGRRWKPVHFGL